MLVLSLAGAPLSVSHDATRAVNLLYCRSPGCQEHSLSYKKINNGKDSSWIEKVEQLIADYNLDITTYKYRSKNENFYHQLLSHNNLRIVLRKKLQTSFLEEWDVKTSSMSKLSFYRQYKQNHKLENYIVLVNNRRHRSALAKLRCSANRLKIEIGR